jgi:hypothetical protein
MTRRETLKRVRQRQLAGLIQVPHRRGGNGV